MGALIIQFHGVWAQDSVSHWEVQQTEDRAEELIQKKNFQAACASWEALGIQAANAKRWDVLLQSQRERAMILARYMEQEAQAIAFMDSVWSHRPYSLDGDQIQRAAIHFLVGFGYLLNAESQYLKAILPLEEAVNLYFTTADPPKKLTGHLFGTLGNIYTRLGDYERASLRLHYGLRWAKTGQHISEVLRFSRDLAIVLEETQQVSSAKNLLERTLPYARTNSPFEYGTTLLNYAILLAQLSQEDASIAPDTVHELLDTAEQQFRLVLEESSTWKVLSNLGHVERIRGDIALDEGDWDLAKGYFEASLHWLERGDPEGHRREFGKTLVPLARACRELGHLEEAFGHLQAAFSHNLENYLPTTLYSLPAAKELILENNLWEALAEMAHCFEAAYEERKDFSMLQQALRCHDLLFGIEQIMHREYSHAASQELLSADRHQRTEHALALCEKMAHLSDEQNYFAKAFGYAERSKANVLLERWVKNGALNEVRNRTKIIQLLELPLAKADLANTEFHWLYPLQRGLAKEKQVLLEYFVGEEQLFLFVVDSQKIQLESVPLEMDLSTQVQTFRSTIFALDRQLSLAERPVLIHSFAHQSHHLYKLLIRPVEEMGGDAFARWIVVPDGALHTLAFPSLIRTLPSDDSHFDLDYLPYAMTTAYSTRFFQLQFHAPQYETNLPYLGVAPVHFESYPSLPQSDLFVEKWAAKWNGKSLVKAAASRLQVIQNAPQAQTLLFLTHAEASAPPKQQMGTPILHLTGQGALSANDFYRHRCHLKSELVILLGCETQLGEIVAGEGISGLGQSFALAGCHSTLSTLWSTKYQETQEFADGLLEFLRKGLPKDIALLQAQQKYRQARSPQHYSASPLYWSGFQLTGNPRPLLVSATETHKAVWFAMGMLGFIGLILWRFRRN